MQEGTPIVTSQPTDFRAGRDGPPPASAARRQPAGMARPAADDHGRERLGQDHPCCRQVPASSSDPNVCAPIAITCGSSVWSWAPD